MNENLQRTIDAYIDDAFNDGIDQGRELCKRDVMTSLTNFLHELVQSGNANQADAVSKAMKRIEKLK